MAMAALSSPTFYKIHTSFSRPLRFSSVRPVAAAAEPPSPPPQKLTQQDSSSSTQAPKRPKKPVYSSQLPLQLIYQIYIFAYLFMSSFLLLPAVKKGQIVRVDKDKYLNSINVRLTKYFY